MTDSTENTDTWKVRRRFMFVISAFCMGTIAWVLWKGLDHGTAETSVSMAFLTLTGIVASYVFGAAWEDVNKGR